MWRRFQHIVLPAIIIMLIVSGVFGLISLGAWKHYRSASNTEFANMLGTVAEQQPDLDISALIHAVASDDSDGNATALGAEILQNYGYVPSDFTTPSAERYGVALFFVGLLSILCVSVSFVAYLYYQDYRYRVQIRSLVVYVQRLNDHIYDLKIKSNTEEEFSLLSNELYKITVTLKEAAEYDRHARRKLETALADISHQLKTPLTSLQVTLDNLSADPDMPLSIRQEFLRSSGRQVAAMASLVTILLNLAKFDNGTIRMQRRVMSIGDILTVVHEKLEILADLQDIKLDITGDLTAQVKLDPRWQAEALSNIVKNCIEHSPTNGVVTITVEDSILYTRVIIRDQGDGIAPEDLHHIFERFYKAAPARTSDQSHSNVDAGSNLDSTTGIDYSSLAIPTNVGIGLSFAKTIIEADHGQVRVKSSTAGTTFIITYFH